MVGCPKVQNRESGRKKPLGLCARARGGIGSVGQEDPRAAELVKLRYFAGLAPPEAAAVLGVCARTADRVRAYVKARLYQELGGVNGPS